MLVFYIFFIIDEFYDTLTEHGRQKSSGIHTQ